MERSWTLESDLPFNRFKTLGKYLCSLCVSLLAIKWGWYLLWVLLKFSAVQCDEHPTAPNTQHMHKRWQLGLLLLTAWQGNSAKFLTLNALNFSTLHVLIWPPSTSHFSHFRFSLLYLWVTERVKFENLFTFLIPVFFFFFPTSGKKWNPRNGVLFPRIWLDLFSPWCVWKNYTCWPKSSQVSNFLSTLKLKALFCTFIGIFYFAFSHFNFMKNLLVESISWETVVHRVWFYTLALPSVSTA